MVEDNIQEPAATELRISVNGVIDNKEEFEQTCSRALKTKLKKDAIRREHDGFTYAELVLEKYILDKMNYRSATSEERLEHEMEKKILSEIIGGLKAQLDDICNVEVGVFIIWITFTALYAMFGTILCEHKRVNASTIVILYVVSTCAYIVSNVIYYFGSRLILVNSLKYKYLKN